MISPLDKPGSPGELVHFGIKGMKWGVRKKEDTAGQKSTPSEVSGWSKRKKTRVENRAKGHEVKAQAAQKRIDEIKAMPKSSMYFINKGRAADIRELEQYRDTQSKAAKDLRSGHLTDFQKKAIIGASVTAAVLISYGSYKMVDSGTLNQIRTKNIPFIKNDALSRQMSSDALMREVVKPINPNYGSLGTKMNCRRATFAYELRRRGYDVKATNSASGTGQTVAGLINATSPGQKELNTNVLAVSRNMHKRGHPVEQATKIAAGLGKEAVDFSPRTMRTFAGGNAIVKLSSLERGERVFEAIAKHPPGSRGELGVMWKFGGAHSMAWENIGGKGVIFDAQTGEIFKDSQEFFKHATIIEKAGITRLDNAELNIDFLKKWVKNVG